MIGNIQVLRAYAALGVVVYHLGFTFGLPHGTDFKGVAIFFVISGFLMAGFAHERPGLFLAKRVVRIVPLYWAATLLAVHLFGGLAWHDWRDVVLSLLFIPHVSAQGSWQPTLGVGWTLVLEMGFYTLFAACMAVAGPRAPALAAGIILAMVSAVLLSGATGAWAIYAGSLYNLHFVIGIGLFYALRRLPMARLPAMAKGLLPAVIAAGAIACLMEPQTRTGLALVTFLVPLATVGAAIALARGGADVTHPWALRLGDASYAIYLLHTIGIEWLRQSGIVLKEEPLLAVAFVLALVAVSVATFLAFERPVRGTMRAMLRLGAGARPALPRRGAIRAGVDAAPRPPRMAGRAAESEAGGASAPHAAGLRSAPAPRPR
jgi:exopolysaccharide production protein ExoZ